MHIKAPNHAIKGSITLNGSKSIANRALIIQALCKDDFVIQNLSNADDTLVLQQLLNSNDTILDAGAGGTTFRFLTAFLALQEGRTVVLTGSERMQQRPIKILVDALNSLGADISYTNNTGFPPLRITGKKLSGGKIILPADISSQYISAILMIAPLLENGLTMQLEGEIVSIPYIEMTLRLMNYFGITTNFEGNTINVEQGNYIAKDFFVEGDWSAASYFYAITSLAEAAEITLHGLTNQQIQGDSIIARIGEQFNIKTTYNIDNSITIVKGIENNVDYFEYDFIRCPDLAQTVMAMCAGNCIDATFKGLQTLKIKETDRVAAMNTELFDLGFATIEQQDTNEWTLENCTPQVYNQHEINTYEDHRMAMALAPLALKIGTLTIKESGVVSKSYPNFWNDLNILGFEYNS
ncbi:MAG: 3-phosphoshikimate 1-carboxyvinyltransferase [Chitinophagales bacterium]|nr:3-phosphoshikimate 1-carboxyvinyltransferase [Chitinophagales bacterium]